MFLNKGFEGVGVSAVDPVSSITVVENPMLIEMAQVIQHKLKKVISNL